MIYDESDLGVKYAFYTCKFMHKAVYGLISIRDFHFEVWVKLNELQCKHISGQSGRLCISL